MYRIGISKIQINRWKEKHVAKNYSVINGLLSSIPGPEKNVLIPSLLFKAWIDQKPTAKAELDQKTVCDNGSKFS